MVHPILFESLDVPVIKYAALHTSGAAGPSGLDAITWKRLCTSFKTVSQEWCQSLAQTAYRLCTDMVDLASIASFLACRLIVLDKNSGVHPIGIGDTARCIIAKAILFATKHDLHEAAGTMQLCADQLAGIEAGMHAIKSMLQKDEVDTVLLVDASNAFNTVNQHQLSLTSKDYAPHLTLLLLTSTGPLRIFTWMVISFSLRKGLFRVIH